MMKKCCQHTYLKQRLHVQVIVLRGRLLIGDGKGAVKNVIPWRKPDSETGSHCNLFCDYG